MVNDDDRWFFTMELVHGMPFTEHVARETAARSARDAEARLGLSITETRIDARLRRPFDEARLRAALAQLVLAQRFAVALAAHRGLDPDRPRLLTRSVIRTP